MESHIMIVEASAAKRVNIRSRPIPLRMFRRGIADNDVLASSEDGASVAAEQKKQSK